MKQKCPNILLLKNVTKSIHFKIRFITFIILCVGVFCLYMHHVCAWRSWRSEEGIGSPGTGLTDGPDLVGAGDQTPVLCKSHKHS